MSDPLAIYLNDHLMGATAGLELFKRAGRHLPEVQELVAEIEEDREVLLELIKAIGSQPDQIKVVLGWAAEKASRLKTNGSLATRAPLSDLVELEQLTLGARGKLAGWQLLEALADPRLDTALLRRMVARAERQVGVLEALRMERGVQVLSEPATPSPREDF